MAASEGGRAKDRDTLETWEAAEPEYQLGYLLLCHGIYLLEPQECASSLSFHSSLPGSSYSPGSDSQIQNQF